MGIGTRLRRLWPTGRLAQNTLLATFWQFSRIAAQSLWVVIIARTLGPVGYGVIAGIGGLGIVLGGFTGLGSNYLMLQSVSVTPRTFSVYWRKALVLTVASGVAFSLAFLALAPSMLGRTEEAGIFGAIGLSELLCAPIVYLCTFAFQAHENLGWSSALTAGMASLRVVAAIAFWLGSATGKGISGYVEYHLAASLLSAALSLLVVYTKLKPHKARFDISIAEIKEGMAFSASWFTNITLAELDKTLVMRFAGAEIAGIYSAAYRLMSAFTLPVAALLLAAQPRLFRQSFARSTNDTKLLRLLVKSGLSYSVLASCALLISAQILPYILGSAFELAATTAKLLVLIPPLYTLRIVGSHALMTNRNQRSRVAIEIIGVLVLLILARILIPTYGLDGAAATVTAVEAILSTLIWVRLFVLHRFTA